MGFIIISYSSKNREKVENIATLIDASETYDVWYDTNIQGGHNWRERFFSKVEECDCCIFMMSNDSCASPYCLEELEKAKSSKKPVIPVIIQHTDIPNQIDELLKDISRIDLTQITPESTSRLWAAIVDIAIDANYRSEAHRQADLKLLESLWVIINSDVVQAWWYQLSSHYATYSFIDQTLDKYRWSVRKKPEEHFINAKLERAFESFDEAMNSIDLSDWYAEPHPHKHVKNKIVSGSKLWQLDHISGNNSPNKDAQFDKTMDQLQTILQCHKELVRVIKEIHPNFAFPKPSDEQWEIWNTPLM